MSEFDNFEAEFEQLAKADALDRKAEEEYRDTESYVLSELANMGWESLRVKNERISAHTDLYFMLVAEEERQRINLETGEEYSIEEVVQLCGDIIARQVRELAEEQAAIEELYIHKIVTLINKSKQPFMRARVEYEKLHTFAQMIVVHGLHPSDEVVRALNLLVIGDMLRSDDDDVRSEIEIVRREAAEQAKADAARRAVLSEAAQAILASTPHSLAVATQTELIKKLFELSSVTYKNPADHEAAFYELTRSYSISSETAAKLVALFIENAL